MATTATAGPAAGVAPRARVALWDNARFVAIFLVVAGHSVQRLTGGLDAAFAVYLLIYSVHIPLFVLVSGHFGKDRLEGRDLRRILTDLVAPYLVFETIWTVIQWLVEGKTTVDYANASWTLWFLLALIWWRLLLPVLAVLRWPLLWATVLAVAAGYTDEIDSTLALSRTFGLLPFFVLGWELKRHDAGRRWQEAAPKVVTAVRGAAAVLVLAAVVTVVAGLPLWKRLHLKDFFFADDAYATFGYDAWWAGLVRLGLLALSALLCLAVLALTPRGITWFTSLGAATLYVYLFHTFLLYPLRESGVLAEQATVPVLVLMLLLAAAITLALSSEFVRRVFRPWSSRRSGACWSGSRARRDGPRPSVTHCVARCGPPCAPSVGSPA
ncbi:acyltransferase family protein [Naasia aerilata]|uniref:Membrane-bound acyltransferase YkrP n=1 Tax=Naasia aerilata TaxID=1162966 RepID=A0ABN6XHF4_9MICO|nr:acyltransferase family protein [Naasia aerilata]BDZ44271.1 putative membrane-bound acyltransferase YkrP [Naasia aerilata]